MGVPAGPIKVFHITHVENLRKILVQGALLSDAELERQAIQPRVIGMSKIKERRLRELEVSCHPGTKVGEYVPFYFCPRSVMLYIIHRANYPELTFRDGQRWIVHLQADLQTVVDWAQANGVAWAFSLGNAAARHAEFRNRWEQLQELNWKAIRATDFRDTDVKEGKQAEFLVHKRLPFHLIERLGVFDQQVLATVLDLVRNFSWQGKVQIRRNWYY